MEPSCVETGAIRPLSRRAPQHLSRTFEFEWVHGPGLASHGMQEVVGSIPFLHPYLLTSTYAVGRTSMASLGCLTGCLTRTRVSRTETPSHLRGRRSTASPGGGSAARASASRCARGRRRSPRAASRQLGPPPPTAAGQALWCHHALPVEAVLDRNDGVDPRWTGWSPDAERAKEEISIADQHLEAQAEAIKPSDWSRLAQQASTIYDHMLRNLRVRQAQERTTA